ncbi:hypothetical protein EYF80_052440 [Liparis tanakae]|uniref:Uncharacterized protein n=1 Tax=Liparis tanakae TaxID=230148 RepID=A0A4Z2F8C6_9TELE|nr:hypothetical protein EYF80_052440 [Liparis tanakae]
MKKASLHWRKRGKVRVKTEGGEKESGKPVTLSGEHSGSEAVRGSNLSPLYFLLHLCGGNKEERGGAE